MRCVARRAAIYTRISPDPSGQEAGADIVLLTVLLADERVTEHLAEGDLRSPLEPDSYLGESAGIAESARPPAS